MKKEAPNTDALECSSSGGDMSPHRSTLTAKDWCLGSSTCIAAPPSFLVSGHESKVMVPVQTTPACIEMPHLFDSSNPAAASPEEDAFYRCSESSSEYLGGNASTVSHEDGDLAPAPRTWHQDGEEETVWMMETSPSCPLQLQTESTSSQRPKRRRNASMEEEQMWNVAMATDAAQPVSGQPRKRRRLHSRKPAMSASGFGDILGQLGM